MTKTNSRFAVSGTSNIEEKYVLYVEDLYVSFKGYSRTKDINKKIKDKEKIVKKLNKKKNAERIIELKDEIEVLKASLQFFPPFINSAVFSMVSDNVGPQLLQEIGCA